MEQEWVRFRQDQLNATGGIKVPTAAMLEGDFSELLRRRRTCSTAAPLDHPRSAESRGAWQCERPQRLFRQQRHPAEPPEPAGCRVCCDRIAGADAVLPGNSNFIQSRGAYQNQRKDNLALDYLPKDNHYLRFRWQNFELVSADAFRSSTDRAPATLTRPNDTASINYIWTISPTMVNEALFAASADRVQIAVQTDGDRYRRSKYGINYPYIFQDKEIIDKIPTVEWPTSGPRRRPVSVPVDGADLPDLRELTNIRGNHTIKFGGYFERAGQNDFDQINVARRAGRHQQPERPFRLLKRDTGWHRRGDCQRGHRAVRHLRRVGHALLHALPRPHVRVVHPGLVEGDAEDCASKPGCGTPSFSRTTACGGNMLVFDPKYYDPSIAVRRTRTGVIIGGDSTLAL